MTKRWLLVLVWISTVLCVDATSQSRKNLLEFKFGGATITSNNVALFRTWPDAPRRCIYGPLLVQLPNHPDWGFVRLGPASEGVAAGSICVPSKSAIHPVLLPTGSFMIINDEGYAWTIQVFHPPYEGVMLIY